MPQWRRVHDAQSLGAAIAQLRRATGMTQEQLSDWMGVDRSTVVRLEAGGAGQLERLMTALSVLGADLLVLERTADVSITDGPTAAEPPSAGS